MGLSEGSSGASADRLEKLSVEQLLDRISGDRPLLPAAGSALALAGATAAAMGGFVSGIAARHAESETRTREILHAVDRFDKLKRRLSALITEDVDAYRRAMNAGKNSGAAHRHMIDISFEMVEADLEMLMLCESILPMIHPPTRVDTATVFHLARACLAGTHNILAENINQVPDLEDAEQMIARLGKTMRMADECCSRLDQWIQKIPS